MPRLNLEVLRKPVNTDGLEIAAHAIAWEPLCHPCIHSWNFSGFQVTR